MKKCLLFLFSIVCFLGVKAQTPVIINQPYDFRSWINVKGALQFPTGCGTPSGTASLNGGDRKKAALFQDSCAKKTYVYNPSDSSWSELGAGGGGSATILNNAGGGYRLVILPNGTIKTIVPGDGQKIDSAANILTISRDTTGANGTVTRSGLRDTAASIRTQVSGKQPTGNYVTAGSGDVNFTGPGSASTTIGNNAVTNAKAAQMAAHTFKGNNTGSTANASDLTSAQLTAELNIFGASAKGLVPAAAASPSSTKYLSEDGTFSTPAGGGGSSLAAGIQTSVTSSKINYDPRINSSLVFNDFLTSSIGAKWNTSNAPNTTISFSSGHMRLVGGNASDYIYDSLTTIVHRWTEEIGAVIQSVGGSDYFSFGIQSQGIQTILVKVKASDLSSTIYYNNGATTLGTTSAQGTTSIGDSVVYRIRRDNYTLYFDVINVTKSTSQSFSYSYTNVDGAGSVIPFRAFSISLNPVAGTIDVDYVKLYNQERIYADWLVIGHSIAEGFNAGSPDSTYYNRLQTYFPDKRFALYALSGSKAVDFIGAGSQKLDMLALRPRRALIMLGINEIQASVTTPAFIASMRGLVDSLENHGVQVIVCNTTPYNAANKTAIIAYNSALLTEFGTQLVNIYDTLEVNGLMQSSTDSLHPDAPGHRYLFNVLKDEITRLSNTPYDPEGIIRIFPRGIESGRSSYGVQSNFGVIPLNIGSSGTSSPGIGYNVNFQTTTAWKYKESDFANLLQLGNSGKFSFKMAASGTLGDPITFTEVATIAPDGNVGVGEITPLAPIHIKRNQSGKTTLGEASMLILDNSSGSTGQRQEIGMGYRNANAYSPVILGNVVTDNTDFTISDFYLATRALTTNTTPIERLRVTAPGNVLIATPTDNASGAKLQVNGQISTVTDSGVAKNTAWIDTDGKIRKGPLASNFANTDLNFTGDRAHNGKSHAFGIDSLSSYYWLSRSTSGGAKTRGLLSFDPSGNSFLISNTVRKADDTGDSLNVNINTFSTGEFLSLNANNITGRASSVSLYSSPTKSYTQIITDSLNIKVPIRTTDTVYMAGGFDGAVATNSVTKTSISDMRGYKQYAALISQSGTSDPTAIILGRNEIGTIAWARSGAGIYTGTLTGAFTSNKTWMVVSTTDQLGVPNTVRLTRTSANALLLTTWDSSSLPTDVFTNISVEIRVYP